MCVQPWYRPDGTAMPCHGCWQCGENRINDLVGRCFAEQATSDQCFSVTLTYAGETPNCAVLCYRDIQLFLKRFRKAGYNVRYLCAGEYGSKKGRAHWHIVIFLRGKKLEVVSAYERDNDWQVVLPRFADDPAARIPFAPWSDRSEGRGFAYFDIPEYGAFRYAMKYALKDQSCDGAVLALSMSKKPPLGHAFFMGMADDLVERMLPVQLPTYAFKGVLDKKGKHIRFCLQGRMREMFLDHYCIAWSLVHGGRPPASDWFTEQYLDKIARLALDADPGRIDMMRAEKDAAFERGALEYARAQGARDAAWAAIAPGWLPEGLLWFHEFTHKGNTARITADFDGAVIDLADGGPEWLIGKGERADVARQLLRSGLAPSALTRVCDWLLFHWGDARAALIKGFYGER